MVQEESGVPQASPESTPAFLLDLDRVPSAATALQVTLATAACGLQATAGAAALSPAGCSELAGAGQGPGGSAGEAPFVYRKTLQLPSNQWAGKEGWEAASHFWAGFLAALTHCDLKQSLSSVPTPPFTRQGSCGLITPHLELPGWSLAG